MEPRVKTNSPTSRRTRPAKKGFGFTLGLTDAPVGTVHRAILSGLPARGVTELQATTDLPLHQILDAIRLPASTFARRKKAGKLSPDESERVYRLASAFGQAVELFGGNVAAARGWFTRPCRGLGWVTPLEMTRTDVGAREVEDLIGRLRHGVFT